MPINPDICECGSQLFISIWSVSHKDSEVSDKQLDPKKGNTNSKQVGFECVECGSLQLTREIPQRHADDETKSLPNNADRDMVTED